MAMDTEAEEKLRKEVQYLTRLIDAHKAIQKLQKDKTSHSPVVSQRSSTASSTVSSRQIASLTTMKPGNFSSPKGTPRRVVLAPSWSNPGSITAHTISSTSQNTSHTTAATASQLRKRHLKFGNKVFVPRHSQTSIPSTNTCASSALRISSSEQVSVTSSKSSRSQRTLPDKSQLLWRHNASPDKKQDTSENKKDPSSASKPRKRLRSIGSSSQRGGFSLSPFIVRRYKLIRIASPRTTPTSFSQRRRSYLLKQSSNTPVARSKQSVHKVWTSTAAATSVPTAAAATSVPTGVMKGREVKTRQGNRQWVASKLTSETPVSKKRRRSSAGETPCSSRKKKRRSLSASRERAKRKRLSIEGCKLISDGSNGHVDFKTPSPKRTRLPSSTRLSSIKRKLASRVVQRSVNRVWLAKQTSKRKEEQFCTYYNRFGRCNRGDKCRFVHDPKRIALCSKFMKGKCDKTDEECPFSHNLSKEKMPVCSFFLRGLCVREGCPYLHVNVDRDAELCPDFLKGFCPLGEECRKKHVLYCPDFNQTGECPRGKACPLRHYKRPQKSSGSEDGAQSKISHRRTIPDTKEPLAFKRIRRRLESKRLRIQNMQMVYDGPLITPTQLEFIPLDTDKVPEYIPL